MTDVHYLYFYRNSTTGSLVSSTSEVVGDNLTEITQGEFNRESRRSRVAAETATADAAEERATKRADLAQRLGISAEDLDLLG